MKVSLIISYYKNFDNLKLILKALNNQSTKDFEAIISEDDNIEETKKFVEENKSKYNFSLIHVSQKEDLGFRKNMMLNKSIKISKGEILVFIDGDCIPHRNFIKAYIDNIEDNTMLKGRRVMLSKKISRELLNTFDVSLLSLKKILFSESKKKKEMFYNPYFSLIVSMKNKGLLGCNWGITKECITKVNGFDEDYVRAAVGEDTDIEWRLKSIGVKSKSVKNKAIVYHIYHKRSYSQSEVNINRELLTNKLKANVYFCKNGLKKIID